MLTIRISQVVTTLLAAASLAASASGQFSVSPTEGTTGDTLVITADMGVDFGSKPKVWLSQDGSKKKLALKVSKDSTSTQINASIKKLDKKKIDQQFNLNVQPKGGNVMTVSNVFTARNIALVLDGGPFAIQAGQPSTVMARFMGANPAKVKFGGKSAKVSNWQPGVSVADGGAPIGSFSIIPNKKLANGTYPMELKTKAGTVTADNAGTLTGSTAGVPKKPGVSGTFGPEKFKSKKIKGQSPFNLATTVGGKSILTAGASKGTKKVFAFQLFIQWQPGDGDKLLTLADLDAVPIQWTVTELKKGIPQTPTTYQFSSFNMSIFDGTDTAAGTFSGSMTRTGGTLGPQTIEVTNGQFNVPVL